MRTITQKQMIQKLISRGGARILSIVTETKPDPKIPIKKVSIVNGIINYDYEKAVNNKLKKNKKMANFTAQPPKWGRRLLNTAIIEHNNKLYLDVNVKSKKDSFFLNNKTIMEDVANTMLNLKERNKNELIKVRRFCLNSIKEIKIDGNIFRIKY